MNMCVDMCIDICIDMCMDICMNMLIDMCVGMLRHVRCQDSVVDGQDADAVQASLMSYGPT